MHVAGMCGMGVPALSVGYFAAGPATAVRSAISEWMAHCSARLHLSADSREDLSGSTVPAQGSTIGNIDRMTRAASLAGTEPYACIRCGFVADLSAPGPCPSDGTLMHSFREGYRAPSTMLTAFTADLRGRGLDNETYRSDFRDNPLFKGRAA